MKKTRDYIYAYEQDLIDKDKERDTLFDYIDKMAHIEWEFPEAVRQARPDLRTIRDSTPAAAVENASIALSNQQPIWTVPPFGTDLQEYVRANNLEYLIDCNFARANTRGTGTVLFDKARSALLYNMIATRTDDLASILPKSRSQWTTLQKNAWSNGRFIHRVFNPRGVHAETSDMGLTALVHLEVLRAWDVYNYWALFEDGTDEGRMVADARAQMWEKMKDAAGNRTTLRNMWFAQYYFIDHDQILRHGHFVPATSEAFNPRNPATVLLASAMKGDDEIVFADSTNEQEFINWSIRVGGSRIETNPKYALNPMLAGLYYSNVWETINIIQSIVLSKPIAELERATEFQYTLDGQRLPEKDGVATGRQGDHVERPPFPQIDPNAFGVVDRLLQSIVRDTGASALGDINAAKGTAFATLNAVIQVIMGRLDIQRRDIGLSCVDDMKNALKWVEHNKQPMLAYRREEANVRGVKMPTGGQVVITADDFDAYDMELMCDIRPRTPTDFQQQVLTAIQLHDKSPLPWKELLQNLGFKNVDLLKQQRISEDFTDSEIQSVIQANLIKAQTKAQIQGQMEAQQGAQGGPGGPGGPGGGGNPQPQTDVANPGGGLSESAFGGLGPMQGFNPAGGGMSTSNMMPGLTRETVSGKPKGG